MKPVAAFLALCVAAGPAHAACKPDTLNGLWALYAPSVECQLRVRNGTAAGRCREDGSDWFPVGGEIRVLRSCDLHNSSIVELPRGGFRGLLEGVARADVGAGIMRDHPGDIAGVPGEQFTMLRRGR